MEYDKIKQLMDDMGGSKLSEINIDFPDGTKISMKKDAQVIVAKDVTETISAVPSSSEKNENSELDQTDICDGNIVKSPMVGTFYSKPNPDSDAFVSVGSSVKKGDVLCIIEAMKLMNEIESEFDGEVVEIFVNDGDPVEYGKPLLRIK